MRHYRGHDDPQEAEPKRLALCGAVGVDDGTGDSIFHDVKDTVYHIYGVVVRFGPEEREAVGTSFRNAKCYAKDKASSASYFVRGKASSAISLLGSCRANGEGDLPYPSKAEYRMPPRNPTDTTDEDGSTIDSLEEKNEHSLTSIHDVQVDDTFSELGTEIDYVHGIEAGTQVAEVLHDHQNIDNMLIQSFSVSNDNVHVGVRMSPVPQSQSVIAEIKSMNSTVPSVNNSNEVGGEKTTYRDIDDETNSQNGLVNDGSGDKDLVDENTCRNQIFEMMAQEAQELSSRASQDSQVNDQLEMKKHGSVENNEFLLDGGARRSPISVRDQVFESITQKAQGSMNMSSDIGTANPYTSQGDNADNRTKISRIRGGGNTIGSRKNSMAAKKQQLQSPSQRSVRDQIKSSVEKKGKAVVSFQSLQKQ